MMMTAATAAEVLLKTEEVKVQAAADAEEMMIVTAVVVDGSVITKVIPKLQSADGKTVAVAVVVLLKAVAADHAVVVPVKTIVAVVETDADGSEILKDIQKLQSADGKKEAVADLTAAVIHVAAHAMTTTIVVVAADADKVDGLEIMKDILKLQNADGKTVVVAADVVHHLLHQAGVPVVMMMTMSVMAVAMVVADGSEIQKDILKLQNVVGNTAAVAAAEAAPVIQEEATVHVVTHAEAVHVTMTMDKDAEAGLEILKAILVQLKEAGKIVNNDFSQLYLIGCKVCALLSKQLCFFSRTSHILHKHV